MIKIIKKATWDNLWDQIYNRDVKIARLMRDLTDLNSRVSILADEATKLKQRLAQASIHALPKQLVEKIAEKVIVEHKEDIWKFPVEVKAQMMTTPDSYDPQRRVGVAGYSKLTAEVAIITQMCKNDLPLEMKFMIAKQVADKVSEDVFNKLQEEIRKDEGLS